MNSRFYNSLAGHALPYFLRIEIRDDGETKTVLAHSSVHSKKVFEFPTRFKSSDFSDSEVLRDSTIVKQVRDKFGLNLTAQKWE